jgi:hypothetical protein
MNLINSRHISSSWDIRNRSHVNTSQEQKATLPTAGQQ